MKKIILLAIAGLFLAANSKAQVQRAMHKHEPIQSDSAHHFNREKMMQNLNLTADQKAHMKAVRQDLKQESNRIDHDTSLTTDQKKEKLKELHITQMQKMKEILTPQQQAKMKAFREQARENQKMHKKRRQMMEQLDLTANQKAQIKALNTNFDQQRNKIKSDSRLTVEQRKEKMNELHKTQKKELNTILTRDQQEKMKVFREQRRQNHKIHKMDNKLNQTEQS